ncbi:MAG: homoserine dehydrogenase [Chloroflexi bacterium]|nr:homoserine dehydrogenase [Chloroflexota bacterium]
MTKRDELGVGLLGLGVVGSGVAAVLTQKADLFARQAGCVPTLRRVLVRDPARRRSVEVPRTLLTTDPRSILDDPDIHLVIEVMGGEAPAADYIREALEKGKAVVTANKEVMAKHGPELLALGDKRGVDLLYEASVGGGIPLIAPFQRDLIANRINAIHAIINGTTNYILTRMAVDGLEFGAALRQAQELGYAEPDPQNDISGLDAAFKIAILASLAFRAVVHASDIYYEGIGRLASRDFRYAKELGYSIKLLAIAKEEDGSVQARVHPAFVPDHWLLAKVDGVYNAVQVEGDLVGRLLFYGQGAGANPTTSAILANVMEAVRNLSAGRRNARLRLDPKKAIKSIDAVETRYYLRIWVPDRPGVLAQIARVLGDRQISIASVIQKEADAATQSAELVIMTHPARESAMRVALRELEHLPAVTEISNFVRVEA